MSRVCPHCSATDVHRSRRRAFERVLSIIGLMPYRCHACAHRFFRLAA